MFFNLFYGLSSDVITTKSHNTITTAANMMLSASNATARKSHTTLTTSAGALFVASDAVGKKAHVTLTDAAGWTLAASDMAPLRARKVTSTASTAILSTSNAIVSKQGSVNLATGISGASLTSTPVPARFAYQAYGSSAASLSASGAVLGKQGTAIQMTTVAAAASLTASDALSLRKRSLVSTTSSASLTSSSALLSGAGGITQLSTTASSASLVAATTPARYVYKPYILSAASLTTSPASLVRSATVVLHTTASTASLTAVGTLERIFFTYAPAIASTLVSTSAMLRKNYKWATTTTSSIVLSSSSARMRRVLRTAGSLSSFTSSSTLSMRERSLKSSTSNTSLITSPLAVSVEAGSTPATTYLTTTRCQSRLVSESTYLDVENPNRDIWLVAAGMGTVGTATCGTYLAHNLGNVVLAALVYMPEDSSISKVTAWIYNNDEDQPHTDGNIRAIVYNDGGGVPSTLVGVTEAVFIPDNQEMTAVDMPFSTSLSLPAGWYWLCVNGDSGMVGAAIAISEYLAGTGYWGVGSQSFEYEPDNPFNPAMIQILDGNLPSISIFYKTNTFSLSSSTSGMGKVSGGTPTTKKLTTFASASEVVVVDTKLQNSLKTLPSSCELSASGRLLNSIKTNSSGTSLTSSPSILTRARALDITTTTASINLDSSQPRMTSNRTLFSIGASGSLVTGGSHLKKARYRKHRIARRVPSTAVTNSSSIMVVGAASIPDSTTARIRLGGVNEPDN